MGLLNDDDMNKVDLSNESPASHRLRFFQLNNTFESLGSSCESVERSHSKHGSYKVGRTHPSIELTLLLVSPAAKAIVSKCQETHHI